MFNQVQIHMVKYWYNDFIDIKANVDIVAEHHMCLCSVHEVRFKHLVFFSIFTSGLTTRILTWLTGSLINMHINIISLLVEYFQTLSHLFFLFHSLRYWVRKSQAYSMIEQQLFTSERSDCKVEMKTRVKTLNMEFINLTPSRNIWGHISSFIFQPAFILSLSF